MKTKNNIILRLVTFCLLVFFIGCATVKKTSKTTTKANNTSKTDVLKDTRANSDSTVTDKSTYKSATDAITTSEQAQKGTGEMAGTLKTYDTTKPVDAATGKPPLMTELVFTDKTSYDDNAVKTTKKDSDTGIVNDIKIAVKKGLEVKIDSAAEEKAQINQTTLTTESRTTLNWWWITIIVVVAGGGIFFFIRNVPFITIFAKIKKWFIK